MARQRETGHEMAKKCGMTVEQWQAARDQVQASRGRGRAPAGQAADTKLANWGEVDGQESLF